jgi:hypothetical protein
VWRKGREHAFPDALSRAPVSNPASDDEATNTDVTSFSYQTIITRIAFYPEKDLMSAPLTLRTQTLINQTR